MTKAGLINEIAKITGMEKVAVQATVESFMKVVKDTMIDGEDVYLRGFGTFVVKKRAEKLARNITANTTVLIPPHCKPLFKPAKPFADKVKKAKKKENRAYDNHWRSKKKDL